MSQVKTLFTQTFFQIVGKFFSIISTFILLGIVSRNYGPEGTGIFTLALTYLAFFFLAADLGLNGYFLPKLKDNPKIANSVFNFRIYWALVLIIIIFITTPLLPFSNSLFNQAVFWGAITILSSAIFTSLNLIFQYKLRYDLSILASSISSLAMIPVIFFLSSLHLTISFLILATVFGWFINNLVGLFLVRKLYKFRLHLFDLNFPKTTFKYVWPLTLTLLINTLYFRVDSFILSSTRSFAEVGIYNLSYQLFQNVITLPAFVMNGFYPMMIMSFSRKDKFLFQLKIATLSLLFLSVIGGILTYFFAPFIIELIAGENFSESITPLRILSLSFPAFFLSAIFMWVLVLQEKQKTMFLIYFVGLIFNVVLNLIFIPQYSYLAASIITVICEYLILTLQLIILTKSLFFKK